MQLTSEWLQVEIVDLTHDDNECDPSCMSFGLTLVGDRSTGVVIRAIANNSCAASVSLFLLLTCTLLSCFQFYELSSQTDWHSHCLLFCNRLFLNWLSADVNYYFDVLLFLFCCLVALLFCDCLFCAFCLFANRFCSSWTTSLLTRFSFLHFSWKTRLLIFFECSAALSFENQSFAVCEIQSDFIPLQLPVLLIWNFRGIC